jgi:protein-disulfide isomerase
MLKNVMLGLAALCAATGWAATAQTAAGTARKPLPSATGQAPASPASPQANASVTAQAPAPEAAAPIKFPAVDPKNFTAASPTPDAVNEFLHAVWGVDENREWRVMAIQPSPVQGFVKVDVFVADKRQPTRIGNYMFLITPDGKHAVQGDLAPFGTHPFAETRNTLQQHADGPARGAASKDLELVEFADLQCPNCKAAQSTMDNLAKDFPQAHIVFQNLPLTSVHPFAMQAAEVGNCVRQAKGDAAFFTYAQKVYDTQADLTAEKADATLRAAVTAAGADPAAVMTCSTQPATKAAVDASVKLAGDLGITSTPTLVVNGRILPLTQVPYAGLKRLVVFQGQLDGITVKEQPSLTTLK